jgi:indolepyruvate ferredoxin oxidoreductase
MNTMLLGLAWQRGLVPVSEASILQAVELNGAAVGLNKRAFLWGRILAEKPELIERILDGVVEGDAPKSLDAVIADRMVALAAYQSERYARRYRALVQEVIDRETAVFGKPGELSRAAAENLHRVMGYKDEYEVARLHAAATYGAKPVFHVSPPLLWRHDKATGQRGKIAISGRVALPLFRMLQHGKVLRGTPLDLFGYQRERRWERELIGHYIADLQAAMAALRPDTLQTAIAIAELPDQIRGYGHVKEANRAKAEVRHAQLLAQLAQPEMLKAAE